MKKLMMITLLMLALSACQKEEQVVLDSSAEPKADCAESARKAKEALETQSDVAFDLSGSSQSTGCSAGESESTLEL